ncbi:hypothetical protein GCM10009789_40200 [Kribbella sancticallisti]|uniref:DUF3995 domain-containing protein n=1 Tax=Kribbella sancticallisti TaxID=460087 RepID=A0ABN2DPA6_9ACTN
MRAPLGPRDPAAQITIPASRPAAAGLAAVWSAAFAALHVYWAAGGRKGLGDTSDAADQAFAKTWFVVYNYVVSILATLGAVLAIASLRPSRGRVLPRLMRLSATTASGALLSRGALGLTMLAIERRKPPARPTSPLLVLVEPGFVVGGLGYGLLARGLRRSGHRAPQPTDRPDTHNARR